MSDDRDWELAGDHMTYTETPEGNLTITFDNKGTGEPVRGAALLQASADPSAEQSREPAVPAPAPRQGMRDLRRSPLRLSHMVVPLGVRPHRDRGHAEA